MAIKISYEQRPVRFLEVYIHNGWYIKIYSISVRSEHVQTQVVESAKLRLTEWLQKSDQHPLENYKIATLILHEGKEGCFAIINWWVDESMLQHHVYLMDYARPSHFELYADKDIITCVWEMAVLWHERNAWIENILKKNKNPDFEGYLNSQLNADV